MITNNLGYKATFNFFKLICKLKLVPKKRINIEFWRMIRDMLITRKTP